MTRTTNEQMDGMEVAFALRRQADERAIDMWSEAHPDKPLTLPNHSDLVVWLLGLGQQRESIVQNLRWLRMQFDEEKDTKEVRTIDYAIAALASKQDAGSGEAISVQDPRMLLAGIKQFGLASDGSDLRDLEAAIDRLAAPSADPRVKGDSDA